MGRKTLYITLTLLLLESCITHNLYKSYLYNKLAPATLHKEALTLHFHTSYIKVTALFYFKSSRQHKNFITLFPGKDFAFNFKQNWAMQNQPQLDNFDVVVNGEQITPNLHTNNYSFPIDFKQNTLLQISYTTSYTMIKNKKLFGYVLRTGSVWQGKIKRLQITVKKEPTLQIKLHPPYNKKEGVYSNIEPVYDLLAEVSQFT